MGDLILGALGSLAVLWFILAGWTAFAAWREWSWPWQAINAASWRDGDRLLHLMTTTVFFILGITDAYRVWYRDAYDVPAPWELLVLYIVKIMLIVVMIALAVDKAMRKEKE